MVWPAGSHRQCDLDWAFLGLKFPAPRPLARNNPMLASCLRRHRENSPISVCCAKFYNAKPTRAKLGTAKPALGTRMKTPRRYYKELRIAQLRAMVELSRSRSFAGAAAALELSTPSVWQQIRGLEKEFDIPLVVVTGQQVELTEQGHLLVELARPVVQGFDAIRTDFAGQAEATGASLSVAAPNDIFVYELPSMIRQYRHEYPNIALSLVDMPSNPSRSQLEAGEVDLAIVGQLTTDFPSSLSVEIATAFPFMLLCSKEHPLLSLPQISLQNLARYPLIMPSLGTNSRSRVDAVFSEGLPATELNIAFEASTKDLLIKYVSMDFGIAIAPVSPGLLAHTRSDSQSAIVDLSHLFGVEHIVILRRRHRHETLHQKAFREAVVANFSGPPAPV